MRILVLGAPGSGKGTYSRKLGEFFKVPQISSGDLLRSLREDPKFGSTIKQYQDKGLPVPDEVVMPFLKERLARDDCRNGYILDGITYNINQAKMLDGLVKLDMVINLVLSDDILIRKNLGRRTCSNCGATFNVAEIKEQGIYMPPLLPKKEGVCDKCGGQLSTRTDDTEEVMRERLRVYWERIRPVLDFFKSKGLVRDVKVDSSPEIMMPKILALVNAELGAK